jgi:hypothetical protein
LQEHTSCRNSDRPNGTVMNTAEVASETTNKASSLGSPTHSPAQHLKRSSHSEYRIHHQLHGLRTAPRMLCVHKLGVVWLPNHRVRFGMRDRRRARRIISNLFRQLNFGCSIFGGYNSRLHLGGFPNGLFSLDEKLSSSVWRLPSTINEWKFGVSSLKAHCNNNLL